MKKNTFYTIAALSTATLFIGLFIPAIASAQTTSTNTSGQALEIGPPVINLTANPGETVKTQINLRDVSPNKLLVKGQINDFEAEGEDGTPKISLDDGETNPYSIKSWVSVISDITLDAKQLKNLPITINVPKNAAPGGYFGVVRFTSSAPELKDTGVSLSASIGSLIFVRVNGNAKEQVSVEEFSANNGGKSSNIFESAPITFVERLKNTGNIHEQPSGQITITDMFNKKVATVNVNLPPRNILPGSIRKFEQKLDSSVIGSKMLFGKYKADLSISYGSNKEVITSSIEFWVIPYRLIGLIILLVVGGITALVIIIKRYNQYIIKKAQNGIKEQKTPKVKKTKKVFRKK